MKTFSKLSVIKSRIVLREVLSQQLSAILNTLKTLTCFRVFTISQLCHGKNALIHFNLDQ